jgi:hypothetical protein
MTHRRESGSALIMAVFVLALLSIAGLVLLSASRTDVRAGLADLRGKKAFFLAEAALEAARDQLRVNNAASADKDSFDDELGAAAGADGNLNFDPASLAAVYDGAGTVTGFTGFGDDQPVVAWSAFGDGWNAAFLTNDPVDGKTDLDDDNDRLLLTAVGAGKDRSVEVVQALVEKTALPPVPSTILLMGPTPVFEGGNSNAKRYDGDDCQGATGYTGQPGLWGPVVGTIGSAAESSAEVGVRKPNTYTAGGNVGIDTVEDVTGVVDPRWTSCTQLLALARTVRASAQYHCTAASPCTNLSASTMSTITFIEGDAVIPEGRGLAWVTGTATVDGRDSWDGLMIVAGTGRLEFSGGGNGHNIGATVVAHIAGPDGVLFTGDDCTGGSGGFGTAHYIANGGGNKDTIYCTDALQQVLQGMPYQVVSFLER